MSTENDFDNATIVYEEVDTRILFPPQQQTPAAIDKTNFLMARVNSFVTVAQYFYYDEEAKEYRPRTCYTYPSDNVPPNHV
jgi:hypothetical protein